MRAIARHREREIRDRPRKQVEIFGKGRREEGDRQSHLRGLESVDAARWRDFKRSLLHCRGGARHCTHESVTVCPSNSRQACDRLRGPVQCLVSSSVRLIGHRPHAEIRLWRDEWNRGGRCCARARAGAKTAATASRRKLRPKSALFNIDFMFFLSAIENCYRNPHQLLLCREATARESAACMIQCIGRSCILPTINDALRMHCSRAVGAAGLVKIGVRTVSLHRGGQRSASNGRHFQQNLEVGQLGRMKQPLEAR